MSDTTPNAGDAYSAILQAQALVRVLMAAIEHEHGCEGYDCVTALEAIQEKLQMPALFCDYAAASGAECGGTE